MKKQVLKLAIVIIQLLLCLQSNSQIVIEAEKAVLNGISTNTAGGVTYANMQGSGSIDIPITVPSTHLYNITMRVSTPMGNKDQDLYVNGVKISLLVFPSNSAFFDFNAGSVLLNAGANTVTIKPNWGYMYFDKFTFSLASPVNYDVTDVALRDSNANQKTKDLFAFLHSNYGKKIISGQTFYWNELIALAQKTPLIQAFDMQNYSPHNPWNNWNGYDDGSVKAAIDFYNASNGKGMVSFVWHWFSPSGGSLSTSTFAKSNTPYDIKLGVVPGNQEYTDLIRDIDAIAVQLKRLSDAGVPVLWRPLHEAGGNFFWWAADRVSCLKLYDIMYDRLTNYHNLHNLIWIWSTPESAWYPGNNKVDVFGYDSYPGAYVYSTQKSVFDQMYSICNGKKMLALSENGPIPDISMCYAYDDVWSFFMSWGNLVASQNTTAHIVAVYNDTNVVTMNNIPQPTINQKGQIIPYFNAYSAPTNWSLSNVYFGGSATVTNVNYHLPVDTTQGFPAMVVESTKPNYDWWNVLFQPYASVDYYRLGQTPFIHFRIKWTAIATGADLEIRIVTQDNSPTTGFPSQNASVMLSKYTQPTTSWKDIYIPLSDFISQNTKLNLSRVSQIAILGSGSYTQSNKMLIATLEVVPSIANPFVDAVKLNQIGYVSNQKKMVIVSYESGAGTIIPSSFSIVNTKTNNAVFTGTLTQKIAVNPAQWGQDGDDVYQGDFSSFTTPGTYKIVVSDYAQQSQPFVISDSAYNKVFRDALRFFYYCRSGEAIVEPYAEGFTRNSLYEGGTAATYDYKTGTRDVKGGWFDAGDMHLDTHAPLASVWWLLETLKDDENKVPSNSLNIPGTKNGVSDLYALIKFELDWYKKMANPDGSVQFWVEQQINQTIPTLSDVTTSAAAILTGLFSKAYPLFKKQPAYSAYADTLLIMSQNSWQWLSAHTANINPINPKTNQPYPYENDDKTDNAMRFFAAVNLFNATGNAVYNTYIVSHFSDPLLDFDNQAWGGIMNSVQTTKSLGYMDYVNSAQPAVVVTIVQRLKTEFIKNADWTLDRIGYTAYNIPMAAPNHLFWGSTSYILCYAYEYKKAFEWTSNVKYRDAISNAIDWALGRNPANRIFVTGYGDDFHGTDLYSFYWNDIYKAPPGYMCGNINENELIPLIKKPWKRFINTQDAALLEPGIYWNAQFAWAMGYMASAKTATLVSQSISLQKGWNIISINIQPSDSSIATIFNGLDVQEIKTTDAFWRNGQPYAFNGLQSIAPGKGYLVNMNSTGTLNVIGSPLLSGLPAIKTGLNLIGCPFQSATPLSGLFSATNCSMIKNFDGFWIPNGTTNSILNLETGKGYFIIGK